MKTKGLAAFAAILVLASLGSAPAAEASDRGSAASASAHRAIVRASWRACRREVDSTRFDPIYNVQACVRSTVDNAIARSGRPDLVAYHRSLPFAQRYAN